MGIAQLWTPAAMLGVIFVMTLVFAFFLLRRRVTEVKLVTVVLALLIFTLLAGYLLAYIEVGGLP